MNFRTLKYFVAVAQELNIGRAAARLNISQPPLTRQIQQLEASLGVKLFNRSAKGVELTNSGELLLEEAQNILTLVEQAEERTKRADRGELGRLDVGIFGSAILDAIPKLLLAFRQAYPDVNIIQGRSDRGASATADHRRLQPVCRGPARHRQRGDPARNHLRRPAR